MYNKYRGVYASYIEQQVAFKKALGFKYVTEQYIYYTFDLFTIKRGETSVGITRDMADAWLKLKPNESESYKHMRCTCLNQLASFLCKIGIPSYIPQVPPKKSDFVPYIFSRNEIAAIFDACDNIGIKRDQKNSSVIMVPALFRFLYGTGLRISEALSLKNKDVNLDDRFVIIKKSKNGKERLVPLSESLSLVCKEYVKCRDLVVVKTSKEDNFFVSIKGTSCTQASVRGWFKIILWKGGISRNDHGPRVHDLRHTFSVHSLAMMAEAGVDLYCSLPVLSTYLGHQSLEATDKYVRLTAEIYPALLRDVDTICLNVFPKN